MTLNDSKRKRAKQDAPKFTGELATPIPIFLSGDDDTDEAAMRNAAVAAQAKLPALAEYLGIKLDSVDAWMALYSPMMMALATATVPGFQPKFTKRAGAKKKKGGSYYLALAVAYEMFLDKNGEAATKSALAQSLAEHDAKEKGRAPRRKTAIARRAKQIRDDLGVVKHPIFRHCASEILRLIADGKKSAEILKYLESMT